MIPHLNKIIRASILGLGLFIGTAAHATPLAKKQTIAAPDLVSITTEKNDPFFFHTKSSFFKITYSSPIDNKLFKLYDFNEETNNIKQNNHLSHRTEDPLHSFMAEIAKQIKFNAAWKQQRFIVFFLLLLCLTAMCAITYNLWYQLKKQHKRVPAYTAL